MYEYETMIPISERHHAHIYMYKKGKKQIANIYIKKSRNFSKSEIICVTFLFTKIPRLYFNRFFLKFMNLASIYIQKAWQFCVTWRFYIKILTFRRKKGRQFALRFFIYKEPNTLQQSNLHGNYEIGREGAFLFLLNK